MSSNSPVLLLHASAVPMGSIMAPLLVPKSDSSTRGLMTVAPSPRAKPVEVVSVARANLKIEHGLKESNESKAMREACPVTPSPLLSASASSSSSGVSSTGSVFSPRLPASKVASQALMSSPTKLVPASANAASIISAPTPPTVVAVTPAPVTAVTQPPVPAPAPAPAPSLASVAPISKPQPPLAAQVEALSLPTAVAGLATPSLAPEVVASPSRVAPLTSGVTTKRAAAVAAAAAAAAAAPVSANVSAPPSPMSSSGGSSPRTASSPSSPKSGGKSSTGRWTEAEHKLFLKGLEQFPYRAWKKIATLIKTRTVVQIRTHAQKYYQKLEKEEQRMREREAQQAASQSATLSTSAVTTPRAGPASAASTPAVAAASSPELSLQANAGAMISSDADSSSCSSSLSRGVVEEASALLAAGGAAGKRKAPLRKRKSSSCGDDDADLPQSSLPKRMMKEKKCSVVREKTMSPKQKTVVSNNRVFAFGGDFASSSSSSSSSSSGEDSTKSFVRGLSVFKNPLDFDEDDSDVAHATSSMMLDFAEEKPTMVDYPFALDTALDQGLSAMENDELLQLSDDESLEWFSSSTTNADHEAEDDDKMEGPAAPSPVGSPLNLGRYPFSPLYSEDCLQFVDPSPSSSECSTPSPVLSSSADCPDFVLSGDEEEDTVDDDDDDFVLDPEKFLSSYFSPDASSS